jgi:hypothetical protein
MAGFGLFLTEATTQKGYICPDYIHNLLSGSLLVEGPLNTGAALIYLRVVLSPNFLCYNRIHSCSKPKNELWDLSRRWLLKREPFHFSLERCISLFSLSNAGNIVSQPGNTLVTVSMVL